MRRVTLFALALLLVLAAPAWGQSAGDEQYQDPYAQEEPQYEPTPEPTPEYVPPAEPTPVPEYVPPAEPVPPGTPAAAPVPVAGELPRTGAETWLIALAGAVLLAAGGGLRWRLRHDGAR